MVRRVVAGALRRRERVVLYAATSENRPRLVRAAGVTDVGDDGHVEVRELGDLDEEREVDQLEAATQRALRDGFAGVRVYVDDGFAAPTASPHAWVRFELQLSRLAATYPFAALCGFSARADAPRPGLVESLHREELAGRPRSSTLLLSLKSTGAHELAGELDAFCVADFDELIAAAKGSHVRVLDLSGLRFVDLAGAAALHHGVAGSFRIESPPPILGRIWDFLGLGEALAS